mgnify:CR=1 FL=1
MIVISLAEAHWVTDLTPFLVWRPMKEMESFTGRYKINDNGRMYVEAMIEHIDCSLFGKDKRRLTAVWCSEQNIRFEEIFTCESKK